MQRIGIAFIGFILLGAAAYAQTQPAPAPAPSTPAATSQPALPLNATPESRALAAQLTSIIGVDRQSQQLVAVMRAQIIQFVMRNSGKPPEEAAKIVDEVLMPDLTSQEKELTNLLVEVWASSFTLEDLKGLIDFYSTPLGKRLIATLPAITQQGMQAGQTWGRQIYQAALQKHRDELTGRGVKLPPEPTE
jgi:hypothetical protein